MGERESGWALPCAPFGGDQIGFFVEEVPGRVGLDDDDLSLGVGDLHHGAL